MRNLYYQLCYLSQPLFEFADMKYENSNGHEIIFCLFLIIPLPLKLKSIKLHPPFCPSITLVNTPKSVWLYRFYQTCYMLNLYLNLESCWFSNSKAEVRHNFSHSHGMLSSTSPMFGFYYNILTNFYYSVLCQITGKTLTLVWR